MYSKSRDFAAVAARRMENLVTPQETIDRLNRQDELKRQASAKYVELRVAGQTDDAARAAAVEFGIAIGCEPFAARMAADDAYGWDRDATDLTELLEQARVSDWI